MKSDQRNRRTFPDGIESEGPAPTPYLNRLAELLRQPPTQPVPNFNAFKKLLALNEIKLKRNQPGHASRSVAHWIKTNIQERIIDHYMPVTLETGDVLLLTQPYHHPNNDELNRIETMGGYVVHPAEGWGFLHTCLPDVYLVPLDGFAS